MSNLIDPEMGAHTAVNKMIDEFEEEYLLKKAHPLKYLFKAINLTTFLLIGMMKALMSRLKRLSNPIKSPENTSLRT